MQELSRAPRSCPHKIVGELAQRLVELRRQLPTFGAQRLKREWDLPLSHMAIQRIQIHLQRWGINLKHLTWQTDKGSEFIGELQPDGSPSHFPAAVTYFGSQHERIPPAAHTYQSDVETVHRLIEDEFFDLESFSSRTDFLAKASLYQLDFNLARPNSHQRGLTPWQIVHQLAPRLPLDLCLLPPVLLDYRLDSQGGYDLPRYP